MSPFIRVLACLVLSTTCIFAADDLYQHGPRVMTVNANDGSIRLLGSPTACQLRVQVFSTGGSSIVDSGWRDGNLLDWPTTELVSGSYRCLIGVTDLDGSVTTSEMQLVVNAGQVALKTDDTPARKVTLVLHDGTSGSIVSTAGDLTFRFGDALTGRDAERMRVTADGRVGIDTDKPEAPLDVNGLIRARGGIEFADGTILTSATTAGSSAPAATPQGVVPPTAGITGVSTMSAASRKFPPKTAAGPAPQFVADATGVHIGTTPTYGLDVAGNVTTQSNLALGDTTSATSGVLTIGGNPFLHDFGVENVFVGEFAGNFTLIGAENTAVGFGSLTADTTGFSNTAVGANTLANNLDGRRNTAIGSAALQSVVNGIDNTAIGDHALTQSAGDENTAVGSGVLSFVANSFDNTAVGHNAMGSASGSPAFNTATGQNALNHVSSTDNTAMGAGALSALTSGSSNIAIGFSAGSTLTTTSGNIDIGNTGVAGDTDVMRLGAGLAKTFIAGIRGKTTGSTNTVPVLIDVNGQLGTVSSSRRFKFDIRDAGDSTSKLMQLRPVTFRYLAHLPDAPLQYGLIAEEVEDVYPDLVAHDQDGQPETVMYQFLAPMLLNELQKEHRKNEEQAQTIEALREQMRALAQQVQALAAQHAAR